MKKGFTLIELLVVVLIIGILSAVALPQYEKAVEKSRMAEARSTLKSLSTAHEVFMLANGAAAGGVEELDLAFTTEDGATASGGEFNTKNWQYDLMCGWCPSGTMHQVCALRRNSNYNYELNYCPGSLVGCQGEESVCRKLGFSKSVSCVSGNISGGCWTE